MSAENVGWSAEEDLRLARMWLAEIPPKSTREIADALEKSQSAVHRRITKLGFRGRKGERVVYEQFTGISLEPAIRPVRVDTPPPPMPADGRAEHATLVWGDIHFPFESEPAVAVLRQIAADLQPRRLICLGDVFDFYEISDHRPPKDGEFDMQETMNAGVRHLADMAEISGASERIFLGGNHEDRWDRLLLKARRDARFRQLLKLPKIRRSLDFAEVAGFEEIGYEYRPYTEGQAFVEKDMLVYTHGDRANRYVARSMLDRYGKNVIFGHKHVIQSFTRRDLKGQEAGWCVGCLCTLEPHYDHFADWHHGLAVVSWKRVGGEWRFSVEQIRIHDGVAIWRDKVYRA